MLVFKTIILTIPRLSVFFLLAACIMLPATGRAESRPLTFGVVPQFEVRKLASIWLPVLAAIEAETGLQLKPVWSADIRAFEKSFQAGEFDFAYMNPYHAVVAARTQQYQPILRDGSKMLQGILVVRKDSPYSTLSELAEGSIAFPSPNALGASLLMRAELKNLHGLDITPSYVKTHSAVYLNVLMGKAVAGGGVRNTLARQKKEIRDALRVLYSTREVSPHPIVAHPRLAKEVVDSVRKGFLALGQSDAGRAMLQKIPVNRITEASSQDYEPVSRLGLDAFYEE